MLPETFDGAAEHMVLRAILRKHFEDLAARSASIDLGADSQLVAVETVRALAPLLKAHRQVALEALAQLGATPSLEDLRSTGYTETHDTGDVVRFTIRAGAGAGEWSSDAAPQECVAALALAAHELIHDLQATQPCEWVRFTARKFGATWHATSDVQLARDETQPQSSLVELLADTPLLSD